VAPTIDLYPANVDGRLVYIVPAPFSVEAGATRIALLMLTAIAVLAMAVILLMLINGAMVMA
jgi:hypothetical protein